MTPVPYSKSVAVLSCVSIIAQSCAIDKVYLISRLHNVLWNWYFSSKLLFQSLYFLKVLTLPPSQELLFQRMQFFRIFNRYTRGVFRPQSTRRGGGGCSFHFVEIFRLVEITSSLYVIVMLEEKNYWKRSIFDLIN